LYKVKELVPIELPEPSDQLPRDAKASITYVGQTSTEPDPRERKNGKNPKVEKSL